MKQLLPNRIHSSSGFSKLLISLVVIFAVLTIPTGYLIATGRQPSQLSSVGNLFDQDIIRSQARARLEGNILKVDFQINPVEQQLVDRFSQELGVSSDWTDGISLILDDQTARMIDGYLPQTFRLKATPDGLEFIGEGFMRMDLLAKPQPEDLSKGQVALQKINESLLIEVDNPYQMLAEATFSGKINLSDQLVKGGMWKILSKVKTLILVTDKRAVGGRIELKDE